MLETLCQSVNLVTNAPIHGLHLSTRLQIYNTMRKQIEHLFTDLLSIVPVFQHIARREVVPYLVQVLHQLMTVLVGFELLRHLRQRSSLQNVNHQYRMVSSQRTPALRDQVRMRNTILIGHINESINTVVDILLNAVVHRTLRTGRACAVVVNTESTATIHEINVITHLVELHIEL